jgi:hypothetical protein
VFGEGSVLLLFALKGLRMRCAARVDAMERGGVSAADYAVMVWGLPGDATAEEIRRHFDSVAAMDAHGLAPPSATDVESSGAAAAAAGREGAAVAAVHIARREGASLGEWRRLAEVQVAIRRLRAAADRRRRKSGGAPPPAAAAGGEAGSSGTGDAGVDKKLAKLQRRLERQEARVRRVLGSGSAGKAVCAFVVSREWRVRGLRASAMRRCGATGPSRC